MNGQHGQVIKVKDDNHDILKIDIFAKMTQ